MLLVLGILLVELEKGGIKISRHVNECVTVMNTIPDLQEFANTYY